MSDDTRTAPAADEPAEEVAEKVAEHAAPTAEGAADEHAAETALAAEGDAVDDEAAETTEPAAPSHEDPVLAGILDAVPGSSWAESLGQDVLFVDRDQLPAVAAAAKDAGFEMFSDLCGVDYLRRRPRFEVVVTLTSIAHRRQLRIRAGVPGDDPIAPSITGVYRGANFYERETYDMFGIEFAGHPDLTRILMPDDWEGYPLRKDHAVGAVPVQFKSSPQAT